MAKTAVYIIKSADKNVLHAKVMVRNLMSIFDEYCLTLILNSYAAVRTSVIKEFSDLGFLVSWS